MVFAIGIVTVLLIALLILLNMTQMGKYATLMWVLALTVSLQMIARLHFQGLIINAFKMGTLGDPQHLIVANAM